MGIIISFIYLLSSLAFASHQDMDWYESKKVRKLGQALVVHGLNAKPKKMGHLIQSLNERGYDVLLLKLLGHDGDIYEMKRVTYDQWASQTKRAVDEVIKKSSHDGGKVVIVAFSLGAALTMDLMANAPLSPIDQVILFSPAIKIRKSSYLINFFRLFGDKFIVPSLTPQDYRSQRGTSIAAYKALFKAIRGFKRGDKERVNIPTVVFIDKKDELVSFKGIKKLVDGLSNWSVIPVSNHKSALKRSYHHLIIDPQSLGQEEWEEKVNPHLDQTLGPRLVH